VFFKPRIHKKIVNFFLRVTIQIEGGLKITIKKVKCPDPISWNSTYEDGPVDMQITGTVALFILHVVQTFRDNIHTEFLASESPVLQLLANIQSSRRKCMHLKNDSGSVNFPSLEQILQVHGI